MAWVHSEWVDMGMYRYAQGYRTAADAVFETALRFAERPESMLWPLAFLWRHHLELMLKWIIAKGRELEGEPWGHPENHKLAALWREARAGIEAVSSQDALGLADAERAILEFERIDPFATGFKYPLAKGLEETSLPNVPSEVNLRTLHDGMQGLAEFLECAHDAVCAALDSRREMEAYVR